MKKLSVIVFLFCTCFLMFACTASDPDNLFEMPLDTVSDTENTQPDSGEMISYTGTYPYRNMQKVRNFFLLDNEVVFFHNDNWKTLLYAYDLNTEDVRFYCDDATCKHGACVSSDFIYNLEVYEGKLYGIHWTREQGNNVFPAVARGNDTEIIVEAEVEEFIHHEDKLYIHTSDSSLMVLEEGQDEPQMILEEFIAYNAALLVSIYMQKQWVTASELI